MVPGLVTVLRGHLAEYVSCSPESWGPHASHLISHGQKLSCFVSHRWLFLDLQALEGPELADALWEKAAAQCLLRLHLCPLLSWLLHNISDSKTLGWFFIFSEFSQWECSSWLSYPHVQVGVVLSHGHTWLVFASWFSFVFSGDWADSPAEGLAKREGLALPLGFSAPGPCMCPAHSLSVCCVKKELQLTCRFSNGGSKMNVLGFPVRFSPRFKGCDFKREDGEGILFIDGERLTELKLDLLIC